MVNIVKNKRLTFKNEALPITVRSELKIYDDVYLQNSLY